MGIEIAPRTFDTSSALGPWTIVGVDDDALSAPLITLKYGHVSVVFVWVVGGLVVEGCDNPFDKNAILPTSSTLDRTSNLASEGLADIINVPSSGI